MPHILSHTDATDHCKNPEAIFLANISLQKQLGKYIQNISSTKFQSRRTSPYEIFNLGMSELPQYALEVNWIAWFNSRSEPTLETCMLALPKLTGPVMTQLSIRPWSDNVIWCCWHDDVSSTDFWAEKSLQCSRESGWAAASGRAQPSALNRHMAIQHIPVILPSGSASTCLVMPLKWVAMLQGITMLTALSPCTWLILSSNDFWAFCILSTWVRISLVPLLFPGVIINGGFINENIWELMIWAPPI